MVGRQKFTSELTDAPNLRHSGVVRNGRFFDMRGMLPPSEARMRMCVMQVGEGGQRERPAQRPQGGLGEDGGLADAQPTLRAEPNLTPPDKSYFFEAA